MANIYKAKGNLDARDPFTIKINTALGNGFNSSTIPFSKQQTI